MHVDELNRQTVAWRRGYKSVTDHRGVPDNPYDAGTRERTDWQDGRDLARQEQQEAP